MPKFFSVRPVSCILRLSTCILLAAVALGAFPAEARAQDADEMPIYESAHEFRAAPLPAPGSRVLVSTRDLKLVEAVLRTCPRCRVDWRYPATETKELAAQALTLPMAQWARVSGQTDESFWRWLAAYESAPGAAGGGPDVVAIVTDDSEKLARALGRGPRVAEAEAEVRR